MGRDAATAIPALLREAESERLQRAYGACAVLVAMGDTALPAVRGWLRTCEPPLDSAVVMAFGATLHDELIERFGDDAKELFDFVETHGGRERDRGRRGTSGP